jgi:hypothetical protein
MLAVAADGVFESGKTSDDLRQLVATPLRDHAAPLCARSTRYHVTRTGPGVLWRLRGSGLTTSSYGARPKIVSGNLWSGSTRFR